MTSPLAGRATRFGHVVGERHHLARAAARSPPHGDRTRASLARVRAGVRPARPDARRGPSFLAAVPQRSRTTHGRPATAVVTRASVSFSDDIRGYGVGHVDTAAPKVAKVSVPHLVALLLDLTADGEGLVRRRAQLGEPRAQG